MKVSALGLCLFYCQLAVERINYRGLLGTDVYGPSDFSSRRIVLLCIPHFAEYAHVSVLHRDLIYEKESDLSLGAH